MKVHMTALKWMAIFSFAIVVAAAIFLVLTLQSPVQLEITAEAHNDTQEWASNETQLRQQLDLLMSKRQAVATTSTEILPNFPAVVNINKANETQLATLPGIGEILAKRIVAYRQEHGDFATIEEIMEVTGIGSKRFAAIEKYIIVEE